MYYIRFVQCLTQLMNQRDNLLQDDKHWLYDVTTDSELIQTSYTIFNAIITRMKQFLVSLLSELFAVVDRNKNLDLFNSKEAQISGLWDSIFLNEEVDFLNYNNISVGGPTILKTRIQVIDDGYQIRYPFSYLMFDSFNGILQRCNTDFLGT